MNVQRIAARAFVILGGVFWAFALLFAPYDRTGQFVASGIDSLAMLALTVVVFVLALFYEELAGLLLLAGALGSSIYGLATGWTGAAWMVFGLLLIVPLVIAGVLFLLAARMQNICEMSEAALRAEPSAKA